MFHKPWPVLLLLAGCVALLAVSCRVVSRRSKSVPPDASSSPAPAGFVPAPAPAHSAPGDSAAGRSAAADPAGRVVKSDAQWREALTPEAYRVLHQKGTEVAFTGAYWNHFEQGTYRCAACGLALFTSGSKYDSGCGWPSFRQPASESRLHVATDTSLGMVREEVLCARCGGHLGHLFDDGPAPTHQRYCINSAALQFEKAK